MLHFALSLIMTLFVTSYAYAQQAEVPVYKNGDWWRVKVDISRPPGVSISGPALENFPEYIVKFESDNPVVLGVKENESRRTRAPMVLAMVLGKGEWRKDMLKFPMRVGLTWSGQVNFQPPGMRMRWTEAQYEAQAWEKIKTPKGEFEAFRIVMNMIVPKGVKGQLGTEFRTHTYFYAPEIKAIVSYQEVGTDISANSTLVDFNLAQ